MSRVSRRVMDKHSGASFPEALGGRVLYPLILMTNTDSITTTDRSAPFDPIVAHPPDVIRNSLFQRNAMHKT